MAKPKLRNRKRKAKIEENLTNAPSKVPLSGKERAHRSRERKKNYTDLLEQKIDALEQQVNFLNVELQKYKKKEMDSKIEFAQPINKSVVEETMRLGQCYDTEGTVFE